MFTWCEIQKCRLAHSDTFPSLLCSLSAHSLSSEVTDVLSQKLNACAIFI